MNRCRGNGYCQLVRFTEVPFAAKQRREWDQTIHAFLLASPKEEPDRFITVALPRLLPLDLLVSEVFCSAQELSINLIHQLGSQFAFT